VLAVCRSGCIVPVPSLVEVLRAGKESGEC
jgi:hypothetical protein